MGFDSSTVSQIVGFFVRAVKLVDIFYNLNYYCQDGSSCPKYRDRPMTVPFLAIDLLIIDKSSLSRSFKTVSFLAIDLLVILKSSLMIKVVHWLCLSWQLISSSSLHLHYQDRPITVPFLAMDLFIIVKSSFSGVLRPGWSLKGKCCVKKQVKIGYFTMVKKCNGGSNISLNLPRHNVHYFRLRGTGKLFYRVFSTKM